VAGAVAVAVTRATRTQTTGAPAAVANGPVDPPTQTTVLAAPSVQPVENPGGQPSASVQAAAALAESAKRAPPLASAAPSAHPAAASASAPAATATPPKPHVGDNGLSRENPFR